ncbi:hypothetical protein FOZ63_020804 [Perkinsus olseni]|uniref:Integrase catalytic domain-containing protein n=1 Tax=Perkinsus olseni TaxID=32597 RepID=A0A7J6QU47_PEROL|nr:hypothetical protein FOZ63_020804 [Perkinsus olseni]
MKQDGVDYLKKVHVFAEKETFLPIVCLEAHIMYKAMAAVHRLELVARQRFDRVYYHVDNVAVDSTATLSTCNLYGVENAVHSTTLPYSPVSAVEQLNRTILHKLQTVRNCPLWRRIPTVAELDEILWSIRSTPSTVLKIEPFMVMYGRHPHSRCSQGVQQQAQLFEHVEDALNERRADAMLKKTPVQPLRPGGRVFVRCRRGDRGYKVGKKWSLMTVLKQDHAKVYLLPTSGYNEQPVERHEARSCEGVFITYFWL